MGAKWLTVVNFVGLSYYVAWIDAPARDFTRLSRLPAVALNIPLFIFTLQRRRKLI